LALTSTTSGGRSVGIVRLQTAGHGVCFHFVNSGRSTRTSKHGDSHGKFVVEEELEIGI
jgi:hypothetical protein